MKLDKNFAKQVRIPTEGMESFDILKHQPVALTTGLYDEIKSTKFYRESGQLHHYDDEPKGFAFYIQREDGEVYLGACRGIIFFDSIKKYLSPDIRAEVILCEVAAHEVIYYGKRYLNEKYGVLEFLARHHPSHDVRVKVLTELMEIAHAEENSSIAH